tara:strand:- start:2045 stop:3052 length:1008 start_codon:yes stop_codon:yes gene_type:complete
MYHYGIVEDRNDPLKIGRVRVRIHALHTDNKQFISSADLPWSHVIMPVTTAGLGGLGNTHSLVEGATVFGIFSDQLKQQFVVLGVSQGISQQGYRETITNEILERSVEKGFNDPRRKTQADYANTTDGISPPEAPERGNELTSSLDTAPHFLKSQNIKYDGKGSEREEFTEADKTLPYYPLVKDATDINVFSTGDAIYDDRNMDSIIEGAKSNATPMYPYNKATRTESGHVVEIDDTRDNERLSIEHRTGTFYEIDKDGNEIHRVVNDNYTVICKDNELFVGGKVNIKVLGDATLDIGGDLKADVKGKTDITGSESITVISPLIDLNGTEIKLNS